MSDKLLHLKKRELEAEDIWYQEKAAFSKDHKRFFKESDDFRVPYKRDVDRIVNAKAFTRYIDKTQVVYLVLDDHLTSRSLHVQLVSNFSRSLAARLSLNEDLVEAIALGHDVGHAPFGHEGEDYLSKLSLEYGSRHFIHNAQSCRLLFDIEPLNLGLAVYDGFLCHSGGLVSRKLKPCFNKTWDDHFEEIEKRLENPGLHIYPMTLEGCLVKLCDKISYIGKDIDDALRLGLIKTEDIPKTCLGFSNRSILHVVAKDLLESSIGEQEIILSEEVFDSLKTLRQFNFERIYGHPKLKVESKRIESAYRYLFEVLLEDFIKHQESSHLFKEFLQHKSEDYLDKTSNVNRVVDYIAGMTDRFFVSMVESFILPRRISL
jgi:dGTPase